MNTNAKCLVILILLQLTGLSFQEPLSTRGPTTRPTTTRPTTRGPTTRPTHSPPVTSSTATQTTTTTSTTTTKRTTTLTQETTSTDESVTSIMYENVTESKDNISLFRRDFTKKEIIITVVMISLIAIILLVLTVVLVLARQKRAKDLDDEDKKSECLDNNSIPSVYIEPADAIPNDRKYERDSGIYAEIAEYSTDIPTAQRILNGANKVPENTQDTNSTNVTTVPVSDTTHVPLYCASMDDLTPTSNTEQKEKTVEKNIETEEKHIYAVPLKKIHRLSETTELAENEAYHSFKSRT